MQSIQEVEVKVTMWQTSDGQTFDSKFEAERHQAYLDAVKVYAIMERGFVKIFSTQEKANQFASKYEHKPMIQEIALDI